MLQETYQKEALHLDGKTILAGQTQWQSPSNIAIVKYWGKHGQQLPNNPSVSLTLSEAHTQTTLCWEPKSEQGISISFLFEGQPNAAFAKKIEAFIAQQLDLFPFISQLHLSIESHNSFPHSSGIASSASSMSALVLALLDMEQQLGQHYTPQAFLQKASYLSRIASGSAARSVFPVASLWGETPSFPDGNNEYAVALSDLHPIFSNYRDSILIINAGTKAVSSRAGHALMDGNPFAELRYQEAHNNTHLVLKAMQQGDLEVFMRIAEAEALQLHALMMTSNPSFILMKPYTLAAIEKVRAFRAETHIPLCFTLDAGPNLHLLYPDEYHQKVQVFIQNDLADYCENRLWINDKVGTGPVKLK